MIRKVNILSLLLTLCMIGGVLCGCDLFDMPRKDDVSPLVEEGATYQSVNGMNYRRSPYYTAACSRYSYDQLNERQQRLYDLLLDGIFTFSPECKDDMDIYPMQPVRVGGQLSVAQLRVTLRALTNDNPYLFWLSRTFSHLTNLDENYTEIVAYSEFSPAVLTEMLQGMDEELGTFFASVPDGLSAYQREKLAHDYLIDSCTYDTEGASRTVIDEENIRSHSVYGALVDHRCVCEGYGMTMQLLLNELGVDCVTLTGTSYDASANQSRDDAVLHLWNAVKLDGEWYHVDPTWDDQGSLTQRYSYFNLNDDILFRDHTLSPTADQVDEQEIADKGTENLNLFVPICPRTDYNYYVYECPHLTGYDSAAFCDALLKAAQSREPFFTFYVDPSQMDFDDVIRRLFKEKPQYFFRYIDDVNSQLYDYEIDSTNLTYYMNKERGSVSVVLQYY